MRSRWFRSVAAAAVVAATASCGGDEATPFAPGLEPLETSTATRPAAGGGQPCAEAINVVQGNTGEYEFAHGRGCVHAPLAQVWAALRDADVTVDRRRVSSWTTTQSVEPQYPVSFRVHNVVRDIVTLEFDLTWRATATAGTLDAPQSVVMRYQKTFGSSFIDILRGSVVARPVTDGVTEVEMIRHLKSTGAGAPEADLYLRDAFASVVARVHGNALPRYN